MHFCIDFFSILPQLWPPTWLNLAPKTGQDGARNRPWRHPKSREDATWKRKRPGARFSIDLGWFFNWFWMDLAWIFDELWLIWDRFWMDSSLQFVCILNWACFILAWILCWQLDFAILSPAVRTMAGTPICGAIDIWNYSSKSRNDAEVTIFRFDPMNRDIFWRRSRFTRQTCFREKIESSIFRLAFLNLFLQPWHFGGSSAKINWFSLRKQ